MVFEETLLEYGLAKTWKPLNEHIVLPIRIHLNKAKPIKFYFTTTYVPKRAVRIHYFLPFIKQEYDAIELQIKKDFTYWGGRFEFNNMLCNVYFDFIPNYDGLLENEDVLEETDMSKLSVREVKIKFEVYCPLNKLESLLSQVNSKLDEFISKMNLGSRLEFNQIIFETKHAISKVKIKNITKIEINLNGCKIEAKKKVCYFHLNSWVIDANTIKELYKLFFLIGV